MKIPNDAIFSISEYIELLNLTLGKFTAKIVGEVSETNPGPTGHVYFTLKDEKDGSVIDCFIWKYNYNLYGIKLEVGMKIIASGHPNVHKSYGFKFIADVIEIT